MYGEDLDDILGVAHVKDCLRVPPERRAAEPIVDYMRPALVIAESQQVDSVLSELRTRGSGLAVVADEYGGTAGIVTAEQVESLRDHIDAIDFEKAAEYEHRLRHDVMAHVHAYGDQCPEARGVIHLGATSAYVVDNADLLILREALRVVERKALCVVAALADFAEAWADTPALGWTHFQPAQPTTVGKRACLWIQDLLLDLDEIAFRLATFRLRGVKGTTGTQASFLALAHGDHLLNLVAASLFDGAGLQTADVDAALRELSSQNVAQLAELEIVVGESGQRPLLLVDFGTGVGALEIEAIGDLLVALIDGIAHFDMVDFGDDIERRHDSSLSKLNVALILPDCVL